MRFQSVGENCMLLQVPVQEEGFWARPALVCLSDINNSFSELRWYTGDRQRKPRASSFCKHNDQA